MYLIQVGKEPVTEVVDGLLYTFPPEEVVEVANDFIASVILDHKNYTGLVQVSVIRSRDGIKFDTEGAKKLSAEKLAAGRKRLVEAYLNTQLQDRVKNNLPAVPPSPAIQKIIEEDGWDLASYGIKPVGWKVEASPVIEELKAQVALQQQQIQLLLARLDASQEKPARQR